MALPPLVSSMRLWILLGLVLGLVVGPIDGLDVATLLIIALVIQMSAAMEGMSISKENLGRHKRDLLINIVCCYGVNTLFTLAAGLIFLNWHPEIWYGWVMLAAVPCSVSVITATLYLRGDVESSVISVTVVHLLALLITPLMTRALIGDAISPVEILKYILLFIAVPMGYVVLMRNRPMNTDVKTIVINATMFALVFLSFSKYRDVLASEPWLVALILLLCILRIFLISTFMIFSVRAGKTERRDGVTYASMAVWKNSSLALTLAIVLLPGMTEVAIPAAVSLVVERVWFVFMEQYIERLWPDYFDMPAPLIKKKWYQRF
ncbi:MAG: Na+-dependent transporter [Thermoplasmatales archaeon]|nr:Na+-dependent transporter [Thermoplasmatales archaeon]